MFLITFCSKEKGSSNKRRVWDCLCTVDFLLYLGFVNSQRQILLVCMSAQERSTFKSKEQLLQCFSFLLHVSDCCNCFFSFLWIYLEEDFAEEPIIHPVHTPSGAWPSERLSHLAPFGLWTDKILMQKQEEKCSLLSKTSDELFRN